MSGDYDRILRQNIGRFFLQLAEPLMGIQVRRHHELNPQLPATTERVADFVCRVEDEKGATFILQLEFQSSNDPGMLERMHKYFLLLRKRYQLPVRQFVLYLGDKPLTMRSRYEEEELYRGFEMRDLSRVAAERFLASNVPEEVLLAFLPHHPPEEAETILRQIILRLQQLSENPATLRRYIRQLLVLSRLRNLTDLTEKLLQDMAFTYDVTKDSLFIKGAYKNALQVAQRCLDKGFDFETAADISGLSLEEVQKLAQNKS